MERPRIWHGLVGGLGGGLVFAIVLIVNGTLSNMGMLTLPLIGEVVGHSSALVGFAVHMLNSLIIGALYVLLLGRVEKGMVDGLHLGMIYGAVWWFVGPLTLMPLLLGEPMGSEWSLRGAFESLPSFIGHIVYGAILGLTVGAFRDESLPVPDVEDQAQGEGAGSPEEEYEYESEVEALDPAIVEAELAAHPRAPLWMSFGMIFAVFLMNVLIVGYALVAGLPHAEEAPPQAAAVAAVESPEQETED